jgi:diguanylate cyclase (GGDEF)-like protein
MREILSNAEDDGQRSSSLLAQEEAGAVFEHVIRLACHALEVPIAALSLCDNGKLTSIKAIAGIPSPDVLRASPLGMRALTSNSPLCIADVRDLAEYRDDPLVRAPPHVRFIAAQPLFAPNERQAGGLCVMDGAARELSGHVAQSLADLARVAESELRIRLLTQAQMELTEHLNAARRQLLRDDLTRSWNRAGILEILDREHARARRQKLRLGVALVDLDHFKAINDQHGHLIGDQVLFTTAERMREAIRPYDCVGRYGGEEFLVVIVEHEPAVIRAVAERIRRNIAEFPVSTAPQVLAVTASVGVACSNPLRAQDLPQLVQTADDALYKAKRDGRNRVVMSGD